MTTHAKNCGGKLSVTCQRLAVSSPAVLVLLATACASNRSEPEEHMASASQAVLGSSAGDPVNYERSLCLSFAERRMHEQRRLPRAGWLLRLRRIKEALGMRRVPLSEFHVEDHTWCRGNSTMSQRKYGPASTWSCAARQVTPMRPSHHGYRCP